MTDREQLDLALRRLRWARTRRSSRLTLPADQYLPLLAELERLAGPGRACLRCKERAADYCAVCIGIERRQLDAARERDRERAEQAR